MRIYLYINDQEVELNDDINFSLNRQYTDISDPTSIIVEYSKTIKVPMTPKNNELFNFIYRVDHQVIAGINYANFDPRVKMPMHLIYNGNILMDGYAVLSSVSYKDRSYEINLYGQLGNIFSDLKNKTIKEYRRPANAMFDGIKMNTSNIYKSFKNDAHTLDWNSSDWTNFFGFAPQRYGNTDLIDTKTFEKVNGDVVSFSDIINTRRGINYADTYVGNGFDFQQYGEVRTYMTRPYVYVDKIIQLFQDEINSGDYDGYKILLDDTWFNNSNAYYNNLVYFSGKETAVENGSDTSGTLNWNNSLMEAQLNTYFMPGIASSDMSDYTTSVSNNVITVKDVGKSYFSANITLNCDNIVVVDRITGVKNNDDFDKKGAWAFYNIDENRIPVRYIGIYDSNNNLIYKLYLCPDQIVIAKRERTFFYWSWTRKYVRGIWNKLKLKDHRNIVPNSSGWVNKSVEDSYCEAYQTYNFGNLLLSINSFTFKYGCDFIDTEGNITSESISSSEYHPMLPFKNSKYIIGLWNSTYTHSNSFSPISSMNITSLVYRSGSIYTINDILGDDFNVFDFVINYVKKFRLKFDIDYVTKTILLTSKYFNDITYYNVNVDYSKEFKVEPLTNTHKTIIFGYRDDKSTKGSKYRNKFNVNYGDIEISTGISLNDDTMKLNNSNEGVFIPLKSADLNWNILSGGYPDSYTDTQIMYSNILNTSKLINTLDSDGKIEYYPFFAFRNRNTFSNIRITDDTPNQKTSGKYTYLDMADGWNKVVEGKDDDGKDIYYSLSSNIIPQFDNYITSYGVNYWLTFGVPKEVYNGQVWSARNYSIYDRWANYLNEIYSANNKKVTCYINMNYNDYLNFKFNKLFVIDNCLFLVNKIIDYSPAESPTKVELIQISNIQNLK